MIRPRVPDSASSRTGQAPRPRRRRRALSTISGVLLLASAYGTVALCAPWLSRWAGRPVEIPGSMLPGVGQLDSFPLLVPVLGALVFLILAVFLARTRARGARRIPWVPALGILLCALSLTATLCPAEQAPSASGARHRTDVVSWNAHDTMTKSDLQGILDGGAQVVVVPESNPGMMAWYLKDLGRIDDVQLFHSEEKADVAPTTVLVSKDLGTYHQASGPATTLGTVTVEPTDASSGAPKIVGVHTASPRVGWERQWRQEVEALVDDVCGSPSSKGTDRPVIAAGDFNATSAHGPLAGLAGRKECTDALPAAGETRGTWPRWAPAPLRAQIDHVLLGGGATVESAGLDEDLPATSDHQGIRARVAW